MIKRLLLAVALFAASTLSAATLDRDVLLTPTGTVYTVESVFSRDFDGLSTSSVKVLQLSTDKGDETTRVFVPATLNGGMNFEPSLAYDSVSDTLFVFWQNRPNPTSSELFLCTLHDGVWSEPTSIGKAILNIRFNLRITTTQFVDPDLEDAPRQLIVHAAWWEQTGYGEEAHYAMLTMQDGKVAGIESRRLLDYVTNHGESPVTLDDDYDRSFFRNISMVENSTHDGVDIVFADWDQNRLHHVGITPIKGQGVIRVPGGVSRGDFPAPKHPLISDSAKVLTIADPSRDRLAYYAVLDGEVDYLVLKDGVWSVPRKIKKSNTVTTDAALDALRRLLATE